MKAVKEFSKARLRKRAQSNILKQGPHRPGRFPGGPRAGLHPNYPDIQRQAAAEKKDSLALIRHEIAIMKKLHHPNLVQLIEVLDDRDADSLYMVLEICKGGVVMKVGLGETADPYPEEQCRHWFRDLILGIEYRMGSLRSTGRRRSNRVLTGTLTHSTCAGHRPQGHQARQPAPL